MSPEAMTPENKQMNTNQPSEEPLHTPDTVRMSGDAGAINVGDIAERTGEVIVKGFDALAVGYHGLRGYIADRKLGKAEDAFQSEDQEQQFYGSLRNLATDVIVGQPVNNAKKPEIHRGRNLSTEDAIHLANDPELPQTERALYGKRNTIARRKAIRAGGTMDTIELKQMGLLPDDGPARLEIPVAPQGKNQLRQSKAVAERLNYVRDERKIQARRVKMVGDSGVANGINTKARRAGMWLRDRRALKEGRIDAFEAAQRKQARKAVFLTNRPHATSHAAHQLHEVGESTLDAMDRALDLSREKQAKADQQRAKQRAKRNAHLAKQQAARVRLTT